MSYTQVPTLVKSLALAAAALALLSACGQPAARTAGAPAESPAATESETAASFGTSSASPVATESAAATETPSASPVSTEPPAESSPSAASAASESPSASAAASELSSASPVASETPSAESGAAEEAPAPKMVEAGTVSFKGPKDGAAVELPLIGVEASYGVDEGDAPPSIAPKRPLGPVAIHIPAAQASELAAYWMNLGYGGDDGDHGLLLVAPRGWAATSASVGANGSFGLDLANPNDKKEKLSTYDTAGGCQGCAVSAIGSYFPKLAKWAEDQAFPGEPKPYVKSKLIGDHEIEYELKNANKGYATRGAAFERHEGGAWFGDLELSVASGHNKLADAVLQAYEAANAVKEMN